MEDGDLGVGGGWWEVQPVDRDEWKLGSCLHLCFKMTASQHWELGAAWSFLYKGKCLNPHLPLSLDKYLASGVLGPGWGGLLPAQDALSPRVWVLCLPSLFALCTLSR